MLPATQVIEFDEAGIHIRGRENKTESVFSPSTPGIYSAPEYPEVISERSSQMRIVLLRHGEPDVPSPGKLKASEIPRWIELYNAAGLKIGHRPSREAIEIANDCNAIVCSDLPRSVESARALGVKKVNHIESVFREMALPYARFPSPRLSPYMWLVLFRALWFLGYSANGESLHEARLRASNGANRLTAIAEHSGSVLLVGHGITNRFIATELLSSGWKGPGDPGKRYWEYGVYQYAI